MDAGQDLCVHAAFSHRDTQKKGYSWLANLATQSVSVSFWLVSTINNFNFTVRNTLNAPRLKKNIGLQCSFQVWQFFGARSHGIEANNQFFNKTSYDMIKRDDKG